MTFDSFLKEDFDNRNTYFYLQYIFLFAEHWHCGVTTINIYCGLIQISILQES